MPSPAVRSTLCQLTHPDANFIRAYVGRIEETAIPFRHRFAFGVIRLRHSLYKFLKAGNATNVFGWCPPFAINEARILLLRISRRYSLYKDRMTPVVPEVVGVVNSATPRSTSFPRRILPASRVGVPDHSSSKGIP